MTTATVVCSEGRRLLESAFSAEILVRQAQGQQVRALAAFVELGGSRRSVTEEVALYFSVTRNKAHTMIEVASSLVARLPCTLAALDSGDIDLYKAERVVTPTLEVSAEVAGLVDAFMLGRLADREPGAIRRSVNYAIEKYDRDGFRARAEAKRQLRHISLTHDDDTMSTLSGYLPSEVAGSVYASLDRAAKARRKRDKTRTLDQHRADLFAERLLAEDGHGKPRAHIHVYVDLLTLIGLRNDPAELAGYGPIPDWLAQGIAADPDATWSRLITDPATGQLLEAGADQYRPPASLARFIKARDRECLQPGCHRPAEFSEIDHIIPWARNGKTDHHHCRGYCKIHNLLRDQPGWDFIPRNNGTATIITPSGHTYLATPTSPHPNHSTNPDPNPTTPHRSDAGVLPGHLHRAERLGRPARRGVARLGVGMSGTRSYRHQRPLWGYPCYPLPIWVGR